MDRITHSLDKVLVVRAEHNKLSGSMLEVPLYTSRNGWGPNGRFAALLAEHSESTIAEQRCQQEIAIHVVLRPVAHRRNSAAAENRASRVGARQAVTLSGFGRMRGGNKH